MPTAVGTYLVSVPTDPGSGNPSYTWINNSATGVDTDQDYCAYAILERAATSGTVAIMATGPGGTAEKEVTDTAPADGVPDSGTVDLTMCE
jgi:hypothetical protein